jgi:peptidoglycan/LPS O-acetylase OafA/YrhL
VTDLTYQRDGGEKQELGPLTGIRFFAAIHIFWFHLLAMHQAPVPDDSWRFYFLDSLPDVALNFLEHGYCSTSLFFLLSGFILAYLYVDPQKRMTVSVREFWFARFSRVYPLHVALLVLLLPIAMVALPAEPRLFTIPVDRLVFFAVSGLQSVTLTQAWVPECALTWNFATWALSAIVFCYLMFPWAVKVLGRVASKFWYGFVGLLVFVGLVPSIVHDLFIGAEQPLSFASELVMRTPLFWLPPFLCGMSMSMQFGISRYAPKEEVARLCLSRGDIAAIILVLVQCLDDKWLANHITNGLSVHFYLRHGVLTPLYMVLLLDLARGRGFVSWLFNGAIWKWLGTASFSIFMLQFPGIIVTNIASSLAPMPALFKFLVVNFVTIGWSIASVRWFEKPIAAFLRRKFIAK